MRRGHIGRVGAHRRDSGHARLGRLPSRSSEMGREHWRPFGRRIDAGRMVAHMSERRATCDKRGCGTRASSGTRRTTSRFLETSRMTLATTVPRQSARTHKWNTCDHWREAVCSNGFNNIVLACLACNRKKHARSERQFWRRLRGQTPTAHFEQARKLARGHGAAQC